MVSCQSNKGAATLRNQEPIFLGVAPEMMVIVKYDDLTGEKTDKDWWMGEVNHGGGSALDPKTHNLCKIDDVVSGAIRWDNADLVRHILP